MSICPYIYIYTNSKIILSDLQLLVKIATNPSSHHLNLTIEFLNSFRNFTFIDCHICKGSEMRLFKKHEIIKTDKKWKKKWKLHN